MKLNLKFNRKEALDAALTFLLTQNAPVRNSSVSNTKGVDVNTNESFDDKVESTYQITFPSEMHCNRAEAQLTELFSSDNNLTFTGGATVERV